MKQYCFHIGISKRDMYRAKVILFYLSPFFIVVCFGKNWYFSLDAQNGPNSLPISAHKDLNIAGKRGNGLMINSIQSLPTVSNWNYTNNCLTNPSNCESGISFGFWVTTFNITEQVIDVISTIFDGSTGFKVSYNSTNYAFTFSIFKNDSIIECHGRLPVNHTGNWTHVAGSWIKSYNYQSLWINKIFISACDGNSSSTNDYSPNKIGGKLKIGSAMSDGQYYLDEIYLREQAIYREEVTAMFGKIFE